MSKEKNAVVEDRSFQEILDGGWALIDEYHVRHLEGMLLTVVDSLGLEKEPVREKAVKNLVRQQVWTWFDPHLSAGMRRAKIGNIYPDDHPLKNPSPPVI